MTLEILETEGNIYILMIILQTLDRKQAIPTQLLNLSSHEVTRSKV
jgi:hypothetical protein